MIEVVQACTSTHGIHKHGVSTATSRMLGIFKQDPMLRSEFLQSETGGRFRQVAARSSRPARFHLCGALPTTANSFFGLRPTVAALQMASSTCQKSPKLAIGLRTPASGRTDSVADRVALLRYSAKVRAIGGDLPNTFSSMSGPSWLLEDHVQGSRPLLRQMAATFFAPAKPGAS